MKPRTVVPLIIGLGVGFFAIKMGIDMVQRAKGAPAGESGAVVFDKRIDPGTQITEAMIRVKRMPSVVLPGDALTDAKAAIGRVTSMTVPPGMPISSSMLAAPGSKPGLRGLIPAGKRAVSVSVNEEACVGGFVMPGARVDVSAVDKVGISRLILSDVEVGAVGQSTSELGPDGKSTQMAKSVTLFVDPEQVRAVHASTGQGKIKLALRGNDSDPGDGLWSRLLSRAADHAPTQVVVAEPRHHWHVVEVVRGTEQKRIIFDGSGTSYPYEEFMARQGGMPGGAAPVVKSRASSAENKE